jgi:hypothetical protein
MDTDKLPVHGISLEEYIAVLARAGAKVVSGTKGSYWCTSEIGALERIPFDRLDEPSLEDVTHALRLARAAVASYLRPVDESHPQNAWLYVCRNQEYTLEGLGVAARRDARRALRELRFEFIDMETLMREGVTPFCDSRIRNGLSDGTPEMFRHHFQSHADSRAYKVLGAWKDNVLVAFMSLTIVEDWVAIAAFASTEYLRLCPNNGLVHFAMDYFLTERKFRLINYGVSSIQETSKSDSLHRFKCRVGFEAVPIYRAFVFHPILRPMMNSVTLWGLRRCLSLWPSNRILRKATGLLAAHVKTPRMPPG